MEKEDWAMLWKIPLVGLAVVAVAVGAFTFLPPGLIEFVLGAIRGLAWVGIGVIMFAVILPLLPGGIQLLVNDPNRFKTEDGSSYEASRFGFFTLLGPGQVKLIVRGDRFVRCIMKFDNHTFRGESPEKGKAEDGRRIEPHEQEYWEVIPTPQGEKDSHPLRPLGRTSWTFNPIYWYAQWVYWITGAVFTGIPPFQTVRVYQIEKLVKKIGSNKEIVFETKKDYSDHFRVAEFQLFFEVPEADTQDKIPVRVQVATTAKVVNPYLAAYGTDNWVNRVYTASTGKVTDYTRTKPLDQVLSASSDEAENQIEQKILDLSRIASTDPDNGKSGEKDSVRKFGLTLTEAQVLDISVTEKDTQKKLGDLAIARVEKNAEIERATGRAKAIELVNEAVKAGGDAAIRVAEIEGNVRVAGAAPQGAVVIIGQSQQIDPMQAAILRALQPKGDK